MSGGLTYQERISDPRWIKAGQLFGACIELKLDVPRISAHSVPNIRWFVQQAALGKDSDYDDPDAALAAEVEKFVKLNGPGLALLEECRQIVKSSRGGCQS